MKSIAKFFMYIFACVCALGQLSDAVNSASDVEELDRRVMELR